MSKKSENFFSSSRYEFAHRIQSLFPEIQNYYQEIFDRRTKNDPVLWLNGFAGYDRLEQPIKTKKDSFIDPVFGRLYADNETEAKEVMSMSWEYFFSQKSQDFLKSDPELFALTLGIFLRFGK